MIVLVVLLDNTLPVYMARQPIIDRTGEVRAYELLFRRGPDESVLNVSNEESAAAILHTVVDIGLDKLVGDKLAHVNVSVNVLSFVVQALPQDRAVLELHQTIEPTPEILETLANLRTIGYKFAIDHYKFQPSLDPFIEYVQMVKIDVSELDVDQYHAELAALKTKRIELVAERVETAEDFAKCERLGFDFFQGYHFGRPELVEGNRLHSVKNSLVDIMRVVADASFDLSEIESVIRNDVYLTAQLLRMVNSSSFGVSREVDDVHGAITVLGLSRVIAVITLLIMADSSSGFTTSFHRAIVRAKLAENLAMKQGAGHPQQYFTAGLLSAIITDPAFQGSDALREIPLAVKVEAVVNGTDHISPLAWILNHVFEIEQGDLTTEYARAVDWAIGSQAALAA